MKQCSDRSLLQLSIRYFQALDIPDEVFEHPSIREIETLASDFVLL